jgi:hypothetical protein
MPAPVIANGELIDRDSRGKPLLRGPTRADITSLGLFLNGGASSMMGGIGLEREEESVAEMERSMITEMYREYQQRYDVDAHGE